MMRDIEDIRETPSMKIKRSAIAFAACAMLLAQLPARAADAPRFQHKTMEQLSPEQQEVAKGVLKQSSAGLGGPYAMLINSPELLKRYLMMTEYLRQKTSVPKHLNEMAILLEARIWDAQYEWWAHEPLAKKAGLSDAIINDIRDGKKPASMKPDEAIVYDFVTELLQTKNLSEATFARAKTILGEQQTVDLAAVTGFYVMVSAVIAAGRVGIPNNGPEPLPVLVK
jgi:4-carboxymuconolactone decarboxylase